MHKSAPTKGKLVTQPADSTSPLLNNIHSVVLISTKMIRIPKLVAFASTTRGNHSAATNTVSVINIVLNQGVRVNDDTSLNKLGARFLDRHSIKNS